MQDIKTYLRHLVDWLRKHLKDHENSAYYILIIAMLVIFVLGLNVFLELAESLSKGELAAIDNSIQEHILALRDPSFTPTIVAITHAGDRWAYFVVIGAMGVILLLKRKWWLIGQVLFVSLLSGLGTIVLKNAYQRERPPLEHLVQVESMSFPSGHALSAMAFYAFVIYVVFRFLKSPAWRFGLSFLCLFLILAIGFSRVYLGVHYPSDVAAGFVGGLIWASFCIILFNIIELWRKRREPASRF